MRCDTGQGGRATAEAVNGGDSPRYRVDFDIRTYRLALILMRRFRQPTPGVVLGNVRVEGYCVEDVRDCLAHLRENGVLHTSQTFDAKGNKFRGQLVGLTTFGAVLLDCAPQSEFVSASLCGECI